MSNLLSPSAARDLLDSCDPGELGAILAAATGVAGITDYTVEFTRTIGGCAGYACPKIPVTFGWRSMHAGGALDVLMKAFPWGHGEAGAYRYLEPLGAPVPRCYGAFHVPDNALPEGWQPGTEVVFLEYLEHIGFDQKCLADRLAFARAYAALHALPPSLPGAPAWPTLRYAGGVAAWLARLREATEAGIAALPGTEIADACAELIGLQSRAADWLAKTARMADDFPVGLIHKDAAAQNAGWRGAREEPLLFDLQPMCVGGIMGDLLVLFAGDVFGGDDRLVAETYCDALRERGGPSLAPDDIARGTRLARSLRRVGTLAWQMARAVDGKVDWTEDTEEGRRVYREWLLESLEGIARDLRAFRAVRGVCDARGACCRRQTEGAR